MNRVHLFLLSLCIGFCHLTDLHAQNAALAKHLRNYQQFSERFAQEKVYLYFDNENYFIGENIWFKAYVLMADNHHYTSMSKTLYVELLSADGNMVDQLKLRIQDGQADGCFYLKPQLSAGFYEIRAYTRCMLNFDENIIFSRVFPVLDIPRYDRRSGERLTPSMNIKKPVLPNKRPKKESEEESAEDKGPWRVDFYPEGGQLVAGRTNQLAFKATHKNDSEATFSAKIIDSDKNIVGIMQSEHQGMGAVTLNLEAGKTYECVVEENLRTLKFALPQIEEDAYSLIVNNMHKEVLDINVFSDLSSRGDTLALLVSCRGKIYHLQAFINQGEVLPFSISKRTLPTGVNEVLVVNAKGQVLCSRLFFIKNELDNPQVIRIAQEQDKEMYKPFEAAQVTLSLQEFRDSSWKAMPHQSFAVSIRDNAEYMANAPQSDIFSHLLLASDLKGYIHQPSWYFEKDDRHHRRALDLLMMVQGWRRYDWQEMSHPENFELKHPIEKGILLDGQVLSILRRAPLKDLKITMWMIGDSTAQHGRCMTDEKGEFNFLLDFEGKQDLNIQVSDGKRRKNAFITINRQFQPQARVLEANEMSAPVLRKNDFQKKRLVRNDDDKQRELIIMPGDVLLKEVEVSAKKTGNYNQYGKVSITYDTQEEQDVLEDNAMYTYEDIPTFLTQVNDNFSFRYDHVSDTSILYYRYAPVSFRIMPQSSWYNQSSELPYCYEVERIEIVEPNSTGHIYEDNYISSLDDISKMGKDIAYVVLYLLPNSEVERDKMGIRRTKLQGYNQVKEFYHPQYDRILDKDASDHRRTLYWNPNQTCDQSGLAKIRFYHNATSKGFEVKAMVLSENGKMGWK